MKLRLRLAYVWLMLGITPAVLACPFDEAGVEVTILARTSILEAVNANDFAKASQRITKEKYLYEYFEQVEKKPLYEPLLKASSESDAAGVKRLLDHSLVLEITELLEQVERLFSQYQKSRLRLIKAKKHLKTLTADREPMQAMKKILKSIGNPGLMGVGEKPADLDLFKEQKALLLGLIS